MSKRQIKSVRLGVEALDCRLVPSATFQDFPESDDVHDVVVTASQHQNNNITVVNDGAGNLRITADGVVRNFTNVGFLFVNTGDGADTVTYNEGSATGEVDATKDFFMHVSLGANTTGTDRFTANVFGDVGQDRTLGFIVHGDAGGDRIDINTNHDTDVRKNASLYLRLNGGDGNDNITVDYDGEVDGVIDLIAAGENNNDIVAANIHLDSGSTGNVLSTDDAGHSHEALVRGDLGNDNLTFAVRQASGSNGQVSAIVDGGFAFGLPENDTGRHTSNVHTEWLEHDVPIL